MVILMPTKETEVLIIGAGAAGSYLAARLSKAGKTVTVLDAGPAWKLDDLVSSQIWARRLRWGGTSVAPGGAHPTPFNFNAGWGLGGASLHHYAVWPRLHEEDFDVYSRHGKGLDWPINYSDLETYYDQIQDRVGLSGDAAAEAGRPAGADYPLPPLPLLDQGRAIKKGFDALNIETSPIPMAILSRQYKDRDACIFDGWCDAGCPIGALYNPLILDIPEAKENGVEFLTNSTALQILNDEQRATAVIYRDENGDQQKLQFNTLILAASVAHNPTLLLNSVSQHFPNGLGNTHGNVGAYFMTHALAPIYGIFQEFTAPYLGITGGQLMSHADYPKNRGTDKPFGSYQWLIAQAMKPNDLLGIAASRADLFGQELHDFMQRATHNIGTMIAFCEELPERENRIALTSEKDANGAYIPQITHTFSDNTLALRESARAQGEVIFRAAGASDVWSAPLAQAHLLGGTIMGNDITTSVTNSYGQMHAINNVVIAGSGLFPSGGAVNPTFTLYALAARTAEHMIQNWSEYV